MIHERPQIRNGCVCFTFLHVFITWAEAGGPGPAFAERQLQPVLEDLFLSPSDHW